MGAVCERHAKAETGDGIRQARRIGVTAGPRMRGECQSVEPLSPQLRPAQNHLRLVTGLSNLRMEYEYDRNGNRIHQAGGWDEAVQGGVQHHALDEWNVFDAMNRMVLSEAQTAERIAAQGQTSYAAGYTVDDAYGVGHTVTISVEQGDVLGYDGNGNRAS